MLINKENLPLVAEDFMNEVHYEDIDLINTLYKHILEFIKEESIENKMLVINTYKQWYSHTVNHFKGEEKKMLELNFPPYIVHKSEHDNCLQRMVYILDSFKKDNNIKQLKEYLENDVTTWLINHIQTMDTVTAMFFKSGISPCHAQH